jgi:hypothetical protein
MKRIAFITLFGFLVSISNLSLGQRLVRTIIDNPTIPRLINPHLDYFDINAGKVKKILVVTKTYYNSSFTTVLNFNSNNLKVNEKRIDGENILLDKNLIFDSAHNLLKITKFYRQNDGKSLLDNYIYYYSDGTLTLISLNSYNKTLNKRYLVSCDSSGNPIKITTKNFLNEILGVEEAKYDYEKHQFQYTIKNGNLVIVAVTTETLMSEKNKGSQFNNHGDVKFIPLNNNQCRTYEYSYDTLGNWIERREYEYTIDNQNNFSEKKLLYTITREIKYKK